MLEKAIEGTREGFWLIDSGGRTLDVNPAMCAMLGRDRDALLGRHIHDFVDARNRVILERQLRLRAKGLAGAYEIELTHAAGHQVACVNKASPLYSDDGTVVGAVGLWSDLSDIGWAARETRRARAEAERANLAKSEFLASMSHELRTPLNAVLGFAQLLEANSAEPLTARQERAVAQILRGGKHVLALVDQVLDVARIEAGRFELSLTPVTVDDVIEESVEMVFSLSQARGITVHCSKAPGVYVRADRLRVRQALLNLLSNAVKYNKEAGAVYVACAVDSSATVRLSVRDTGDGIPGDRHGEVFEPFNRLGRQSSDIEGTGVGLMLARRLVEAMGGTLGFESVDGEGSTFWMDLPRAHSALVPAQPPPREPEPSIAELRGKVLYVEDNASNVMLMEDLLQSHSGVELRVARDAETGLVLARDTHPDLVLLDINLPGADGFAALRSLRALEGLAEVPVVAVSAVATGGVRERALAAGFDTYLSKPVDHGQLREVLQRHL